MNNLNGILLVIASMAAFTVEDMFIKQLSTSVSVGQILIILGLGSATIFALLARRKGHSLTAATAWKPLFLMRAFAEAIAAMSFATALSLVDISTVAAVFQATPLAVTMGAALFLGETVGWRRWSAVCVGFIGVILIIRPGLDGFEPPALFALIAVVGVCARDLITRKLDNNVSSAVVSFQGFAALIPAGIVLMLITGSAPISVESTQAMMFVGGIIFGAMGYYGIVAAMRVGEASAVMPFRYTRLVFSMLVGIVVFGERPDLVTLFGASLIIGSGLYTFLRERALAQPA
ncbi:Riboflavin transporter [Roseovarius albus]|uniref:Riboflavin transporter n=1 Tax=Roseovarius albus TaxID=1247867 RepID=A0A1X6ZC53_9RHOB|nr:DMT family transporter [Roseovarius albus]SLN46852.1 Riboflavin transporter [Roseovarius albus]